MNRTAAHLLTRLYPCRWRERYGAEFEALLDTGDSGLGTACNVFRSAFCEHIFPTRGDTMGPHLISSGALLKKPSAFLPLAMSLTALATVLADVALFGVVHGGDEGAAAHLWQLLMAAQIPVILLFAVRWLPRAPRQTLLVLAEQTGAALASCAAVFFLT